MNLKPVAFTVSANNKINILTTPIKIYSTKDLIKISNNLKPILVLMVSLFISFCITDLVINNNKHVN